MNIDDVIPSDLILYIFKHLSTRQRVKIRRVRKSWEEMINKNQLFCRYLEIGGISLEEIVAAIRQFDKRSGSTSREVEVNVKSAYRSKEKDLSEMVRLLERSGTTLLVLSRKHWDYLTLPFSKFPNLVIARFGSFYTDMDIQVLKTSPYVPGILQVLGLESYSPSTFQMDHLHLFLTLTSLKSTHSWSLLAVGLCFNHHHKL